MEQETAQTLPKERAFTLKAIVAGMIGLFLITAGSQITPTLASQTLLGGYIGTAVFFMYFLVCLVWNPLCSRFIPRLRFNRKELAVIMMLYLVGAGFSWIGWLRTFYAQMAMVPQAAVTTPNWKSYGIMEFLNKATFPNNGEFDERVLGGFINGQSMDRSFLGLSEVFSRIPFSGWENMKYWAILFILVSLMCLALVLIVHRQWIRNEKLAYPIASIAESLLPTTQGHHLPDLLRSNIFWLSFVTVFCIYLYNFLVAAFPTSGFSAIPLTYSLAGLDTTFPIIRQTDCTAMLTTVTISGLLIGIAYFLPPALSLSVGLNGFVYLLFAMQVYEITGSAPKTTEIAAFRSGAYVAFIITLVILGRRYYGPLFLKALGIVKLQDDDEKTAVLGARMFILTALGTVFMFCMLGMDLPYAVILTLTLIVVYLVFTRIICEVGLPEMATPFTPSALMPEYFGASAIGPKNLMAGGSASGVFFGDLSQLLMPNLATGMKLSHDAGVRIRRIAYLTMIAIIIAFGVAFFVHFWQNYSIGIIDTESKTTYWTYGINDGTSAISRLFINGELDEAAGLSFMERLGKISSGTSYAWIFFLIGIAAVFFTGFMRTRFLWWPFHAVIFCIWKTDPACTIWASFLIGWLIRTIVVRFGGEHNYLRMKPMFFGLIYGYIFSAGMMLLYGVIYYFCTGVSTSIIFKV